jgi:hypothetical protein
MWATAPPGGCTRVPRCGEPSGPVPAFHGAFRAASFVKNKSGRTLRSCGRVVGSSSAEVCRCSLIPRTVAGINHRIAPIETGQPSVSLPPARRRSATVGLARRTAARANVMAAGRFQDGMEVGAGGSASPGPKRSGAVGARREGLGAKENPSRRAFRVTFCIATLNLASYSEDKGERKVNHFLRSGVNEHEGRSEGDRMWRRWLPRSVFCAAAVGFCASAPRDSCNDGKVIVNGHAQNCP